MRQLAGTVQRTPPDVRQWHSDYREYLGTVHRSRKAPFGQYRGDIAVLNASGRRTGAISAPGHFGHHLAMHDVAGTRFVLSASSDQEGSLLQTAIPSNRRKDRCFIEVERIN